MTRERAKEMLPYIQALAEGKTIQIYDECVGWADCKDPSFCMRAEYYRIKPEEDAEKEYRPFKDTGELIANWHKKVIEPLSNVEYNEKTGYMFMPEIWVREKDSEIKQIITGFGEKVVKFSPDYTITLASLFNNYVFLDDSPCGVLEEYGISR